MQINESLKHILDSIQKCCDFYLNFCDLWNEYWDKNELGKHFNQKKSVVKESRNKDIYEEIMKYYNFLNNNLKEFSIDGKSFFDYESRIKGYVSLESKIDKYIYLKKEQGKIPINKCLNDLFGMRFTIFDQNTYNEIDSLIKKEFPDMKLELRELHSTNFVYRAKHLYLKKDNFNFQWELQLWYQGNEEENKRSHNEKDEHYTSVPKDLKENL